MYLAKLPSFFCQQERQINYELKTFSSFKDELVDPEKVEKYQRFMPGANERIFAMMEKEQEHRHRLEKTQMKTWSCIMIFKMMILIICPVVFFYRSSLYLSGED